MSRIVPAAASLALLIAVPLLSGCVYTVYHVATTPVRVGSKVVDWTTTSQSEADRNYGRKMRKQQAREAKERTRQQKEAAEQARAQGNSPY